MNTPNFSLVPLQHANLCLDCETITAARANCPACGSGALLNVARALSGTENAHFSGSHTTITDTPVGRRNRQGFWAKRSLEQVGHQHSIEVSRSTPRDTGRRCDWTYET